MNFSSYSTLYRVLSVAICVSCLSAGDVSANGSIAFGLNSQSAGAGGGRIPLDLVFQGSVGLAGLQFKIIGALEGIRFTDIERGEVVIDALAWSLDYSVNRGGDTMIAVLWSRNGSSLPEGIYNGLLSVGISAMPRSSGPVSLMLKEIHSALGDGLGSTAGIGIGTPASINIFMEEKIPARLSQNFPNPCNPSTSIRYDVPEQGHITLKVYNAMGQEVRTVIDGVVAAGEFETVLSMDGLPSGMYFYRFSGSGFENVRKMLLLK